VVFHYEMAGNVTGTILMEIVKLCC